MTEKIEITLPAEQLEGTEATLTRWLINVGDTVTEGQPVAELETDKVSIEVVAPTDGVLTEFVLNPGDKAEPDAVLARLGNAIKTTTLPPGDQTVDLVFTADQQEGTVARLSQWLVKAGDAVIAQQPVAELETDKVAVEITAPVSGTVQELLVEVGAEVQPGEILGRLSKSAQPDNPVRADTTAIKSATTHPNEIPKSGGAAREKIGPAVRKLVAEHNLDLDTIAGTGRGGRVTRDDVIAYLNSNQTKANITTSAQQSANEATGDDLHSRMVPHTQMRKVIARHMADSLLKISPHVTSVFEMDMSRIIKHRKLHKPEFAEQGVNLTFTAYFLSACATAMKAVPEINARFHEEALELFEQVNIGVGTALGDSGLVVPVVQRVETMSLFDIARALHEQTERARNGKLTPADMKGGTFTISNHGVSGSLFAAPIIINQPQVAILGVGKMEKRVTVIEQDGDDLMVIKPMCYVSLSIDHRAVDAFQTNAWLSRFVDVIESWE